MQISPQRNYSKTLDEEVQSVVFPSGLTALFCPKPGFKKKYACYSTFYGSVDNQFVDPSGTTVTVPDGIAHFLEHTLFETDEGNVSDLFSQRGAYCNAATSFTTTTYLFASTDDFFENLRLLLRFVENPAFKADKVEKEKGIIEQEIKGYDDNPHWVSYMGLLENLFENHPIRIDIAGTAETIRKVDVDLLQQCFSSFYAPSNMILFVVGDVESGELFDFIQSQSRFASGAARDGGVGEVQRLYPREPAAVFRRETRRSMEVALPKLLLGFKEVNLVSHGDEFVLHDLASAFALELLFGRSSDIFQEFYEAQLILEDFGGAYSMGAGIGYGLVGGDTPRPDELCERILGKIASFTEKGIDPEGFEREKRKFIGNFIRGFNSLEYIASHYTDFRFHGFDLFRSVDILTRLDQEMLEERMRSLLDPSNYASYIVEPA
jgi:predicted Zn-dependent peptidase